MLEVVIVPSCLYDERFLLFRVLSASVIRELCPRELVAKTEARTGRDGTGGFGRGALGQ